MSPGFRHVYSGKVRELYQTDDGIMLLVATDRISAFDVVLPTPIPSKGRVLNGLSRWWFLQSAPIVRTGSIPWLQARSGAATPQRYARVCAGARPSCRVAHHLS